MRAAIPRLKWGWLGCLRTQELSLCGNALGPQCGALVAAVVVSCRLTTLSLGSNALGDEGVRSLAAALRPRRTPSVLQRLRLNDNVIGVAGLLSLAEALRGSGCALLALDLMDNDVAAGGTNLCGVEALCAALGGGEQQAADGG